MDNAGQGAGAGCGAAPSALSPHGRRRAHLHPRRQKTQQRPARFSRRIGRPAATGRWLDAAAPSGAHRAADARAA